MNLVPDMTTPVFHASLDEPVGELRGVHVWACDLDAAGHDWMDRGDGLSPDERLRAQRLRRPEDRRRFVRSHAITRHLLAGILRQPADGIAFGCGASGKPFVQSAAGAGLAMDFNISHSENTYLFGICFGGTVGVDVETIREMPDWRSVAESYFSPAAMASLQTAPTSEQQDGFFRDWTLAEASAKRAGRGISEKTREGTSETAHERRQFQTLLQVGRGRAAVATVWTV